MEPNKNTSESPEVRLARLEERLNAADRATILQAAEYARRLETLNHAHEKAVEVQNTYVTIDKFDDSIRASQTAREVMMHRMETRIEKIDEAQDAFLQQDLYNERHAAIQDRLTTVELWQSNLQGRFLVLAMFAGVFVAAVSAIITHIAT